MRNTLALALAGLAVVIASTGTAVAVAPTVVNLADAGSGKTAKIDTGGRLLVSDATSNLSIQTAIFPNTSSSAVNAVAVTVPTTATLVVSDLALDNSLNLSLANNNLRFGLVKITVGSGGNCYDADRTVETVRRYGVLMGQTTVADYPAPILFRPTDGKAYCIGAVVSFAGTAAASSYALYISVGARVAAGSYSGAGIAAVPLEPAQAQPPA